MKPDAVPERSGGLNISLKLLLSAMWLLLESYSLLWGVDCQFVSAIVLRAAKMGFRVVGARPFGLLSS